MYTRATPTHKPKYDFQTPLYLSFTNLFVTKEYIEAFLYFLLLFIPRWGKKIIF